jgi:hypothetical protein
VDTHSYPAPGSITGQILNPKGTSIDDMGLEGICLYAYGYDPTTGALAPSASAATCTNSMGGYVLSGLSWSGAANYQVAMVDPTGTYPTQWIVADQSSGFGQRSAPRFSAEGYLSMAMTPTANFYPVMEEGGSISGTVLDASGQPRVGACVYIDYAEDGTYVGQGAVTDANGHYTLTNLAPSTNLFGVNPGYKVGFYADCTPGQPPTTHWNGGASSEAAAPSIAVLPGADTSGVDAQF